MPTRRAGVPVVVVGNLLAGGVGKTPLVIHLCRELAARGRHPGVISRGHGGATGDAPLAVGEQTPAAACGDEPLLIRRRTGVPVFVGRDRVAAAQALVAAHRDVDVIISDDGLQHLALARDMEIVVFDARGEMNGWVLPAGPLREGIGRVARVDAVVGNGCAVPPRLCFGRPLFRMDLQPGAFVRLYDGEALPPADWRARHAGLRVHAFAGIGAPQRFFDTLAALDIDAVPHFFDDHHAYVAADLAFDADVLLTTEKDAVKFSALALPTTPIWVLPVDAVVSPDLVALVLEKLDGRPSA